MLFDLRSPRRRGVIKVIYATLAVLMGGGLILFGIGGEVSGGLLDGLGIGQGRSGGGIEDQVDEAEQRVEENPRNPVALADLTQVYIQAGNQEVEGVDESTGVTILGSASEEYFNQAADTWDRYLKLNPKTPDDSVALQLAGAFFLLAQNADTASNAATDLTVAADAQAVAADVNPSVGNLRFLAIYQYLAGQFAAGDRTVDRLVEESNPKQSEAIRRQFESIRKQGEDFQQQVKAENKGAGAGGNPLEEPGGLGGGGLGATGGLGG